MDVTMDVLDDDLVDVALNFCGGTSLARFSRTSRWSFGAAGRNARRRLEPCDKDWTEVQLDRILEDATMRHLVLRGGPDEKNALTHATIALVASLELKKHKIAVTAHALVLGGSQGTSLHTCGRGRSGQRCARSVSDATEFASVPAELLPMCGPMSCVAAGDKFSLVIAGPGILYGCGEGAALGGAAAPCSSCAWLRPVLTLRSRRVFYVTAGAEHALLIVDEDRKLVALGGNSDGQLGVGDRKARSTPAPVVHIDGTPLRGLTDVSAGENHSLCCVGGRLYSWGASKRGQLGTPDRRAVSAAREVPLQYHIVAVAAGTYVSLALNSKGTVFACGDARSGALGLMLDDGWGRKNSIAVFTCVDTLAIAVHNHYNGNISFDDNGMSPKIVNIAAGYGHALALDDAGTVYSWGGRFSAHADALGRGYDADPYPTAVDLPGPAVAIACGGTVQPGTSTSLVTLASGAVLAAGGSRFVSAPRGAVFAEVLNDGSSDSEWTPPRGSIQYTFAGVF